MEIHNLILETIQIQQLVILIDTSIVGSTVTYTYTADADTVGNAGTSVSRTVTVIDYKPFNVTSLTVSDDNSVNGIYAKAGDEIRLTLKTDAIIENVVGTILGDDDFTLSESRGNTIMRKIVTENDINGNLTLNIFASMLVAVYLLLYSRLLGSLVLF